MTRPVMIRTHPHFFLAGYLCSIPLLATVVTGVIFLRPKWIERAVEHWDDRWTKRLERGESLMAAGQWRDAASYLEALDRCFPAQYMKHKRSGERKRLLDDLGSALEKDGRPGVAVEAFKKLADFDPRDYHSHYRLGLALAHGGRNKEALEAFQKGLAINPSHLASVERVVAYYCDTREFSHAVAVYEDYLNATLYDNVAIACGQAVMRLQAPVDGRIHSVSAVVEDELGAMLEVRESTYTVELVSAQIHPPSRWGEYGKPAPLIVNNTGISSSLRLDVAALERPCRIDINLRLLKPVSREIWSRVQHAYESASKTDQLAEARRRSDIR